MNNKNIVTLNLFVSCCKIIGKPTLCVSSLWTIKKIIYNFFYLQYKAAIQKKVPVTSVDHELDEAIPFIPQQVAIYQDFSSFWIRSQAFLVETFGKSAYPAIKDFIRSIGSIYAFAAQVYTKNFSTTKRPYYTKDFHFRVIHTFDPHLMCIPSLHVMVVIWTVVKVRNMLNELNAQENYAEQIRMLKDHAIAITESILYIKQHSINCIAAALYALTSFAPKLFPQNTADDFIQNFFKQPINIKDEDCGAIKQYITRLYHQFVQAGKNSADWTEPLLDFLKNYQGAVNRK